jgi:pimeloyl-ACP methyl ester carboxylesterase
MRRWWVGFLVLSAAVAGAGTSPAQDENKMDVSFDTFDDVKLVGTFYRGQRGPESPAVLMIHKFQGNRKAPGWEELAKTLQDKGFAVLTFDLRGHGGSTSVGTKFWNWEHNTLHLRGGTALRNKGQVTFKDFKSGYWPVLVNDVVAARHFLDKKNDAQQCNTGSIIVIGAQEGAGLGAAWTVHEFDRRSVPSGTSVGAVGIRPRIPGEDIAAGVWLGPVQRSPVTGTSFRIADWFGRNTSSRVRAEVPQLFIFGKQDSNSALAVPQMLAAVRKNPEGLRTKHTFDREEVLAVNLPGQELVNNASLNVPERILKYVDDVLTKQRKQIVWKEQNPSPPERFPLQAFGYH